MRKTHREHPQRRGVKVNLSQDLWVFNGYMSLNLSPFLPWVLIIGRLCRWFAFAMTYMHLSWDHCVRWQSKSFSLSVKISCTTILLNCQMCYIEHSSSFFCHLNSNFWLHTTSNICLLTIFSWDIFYAIYLMSSKCYELLVWMSAGTVLLSV